MNLTLGQKSLLLVLLPVIFEIVFVLILFGLLRQAEYEVWRETHSKAIVSEANDIWRLSFDSGIALFTFAATKQSALAEHYAESESQLMTHLSALELLTTGHKKEEELFAKVQQDAQAARLALRNVRAALADMSLIDSGPRIRALRKNFEAVAPKLISSLNDLTEYEKHIAETSPKQQEKTRQLVIVFLAAGILTSTVLAFALARYFNKEAISRIATVVDNTRKLAEHQPLNKSIGGNDEIARLDTVFHEMAEALDEAAQRKQELMSMVSHDLRSPLMAVEITLGLISDGGYGEMPQKMKDPIYKSRRNTVRLIELINDLLDIEKLESGTLSMNIRATNLSPIFDRAFDAVSASAEKKTIDIEMQDADYELLADPDRLAQVLINLLSNAIKFSPDKSVIKVTAAQVQSNDSELIEVRVSDQGRGIPAEKTEKIFERFQQLEEKDGERGKGTGLGLAICKAIIEEHKGSIGVDSELGKGSQFWFKIPKSQVISLFLLVIASSLLFGCGSVSMKDIERTNPFNFVSNSYRLRCWERYCLNGEKAMLAEKYKTARNEFQKALSYADSEIQLRQTEERIAKAYISLADYSAAIPHLLSVLEHNKQMPARSLTADTTTASSIFSWTRANTVASLGFSQLQLEKLNLAEAYLKESIEICKKFSSDTGSSNTSNSDPNLQFKILRIDATANLIECLRRAKKDSEAEQIEMDYARLLASTQAHPSIDKLASSIKEAKEGKSADKTIALLEPLVYTESARSNTPEFKQAMMLLAGAYADKGDDQKAESIIADLVSVMKKDVFVFSTDIFRVQEYFARSCLHNGHYLLSIAIANRALKLKDGAKSSQLADLHLALAQDYCKLADRQKAKESAVLALDYAKKIDKPNDNRMDKIRKFISEMQFDDK